MPPPIPNIHDSSAAPLLLTPRQTHGSSSNPTQPKWRRHPPERRLLRGGAHPVDLRNGLDCPVARRPYLAVPPSASSIVNQVWVEFWPFDETPISPALG